MSVDTFSRETRRYCALPVGGVGASLLPGGQQVAPNVAVVYQSHPWPANQNLQVAGVGMMLGFQLDHTVLY